MPECAICGCETEQIPSSEHVCEKCDRQAVNEEGDDPWHGFPPGEEPETEDGVIRMAPDAGENPVFINGHKCERRYKFGGWITRLIEEDSDEAPSDSN